MAWDTSMGAALRTIVLRPSAAWVVCCVLRFALSGLLGCGLSCAPGCATAPVMNAPPATPAPGPELPTTTADTPASVRRPDFTFSYEPIDDQIQVLLRDDLERGRALIEAFFGEPFAEPLQVLLLPDRAAFTASLPPEWGMTETQCWMVAAGVADGLYMLSPRAWSRDACEHDGADQQHVRNIVAHELMHAFHMQHNPTRDGTGLEPLGWFVEGLATYASGQLEEGHTASALQALEAGAAPARLADGWAGKYRYGVSGSLVEYVDITYGRDTLRQLLQVTTQEALLDLLAVRERELLDGWERFVRRRD
jgi:hypothetical protein